MSAKTFRRHVRRAAAGLVLAAVTLSAWTVYSLWPRHMATHVASRVPTPKRRGHRLVVPIANEVAAAELGRFDDQLEALLHLGYLRGREPGDADKLLLTSARSGHRTTYKIILLVENDRLVTVPRLNQWQAHGLITRYELEAWSQEDLHAAERQSEMLEAAYNVPASQKLEALPSFQLLPALADFLAFKSQTDWRVVGQSANAPHPLSQQQALAVAADILDVAHFYDLPLDYFLGVGAMENNYMNVDGDLAHTVWKAHAERGDIVLQHKRKRVLVSDYSMGAWQISRETVRSAHQLYLKDKRDYSKLPARLRPPRELDLNSLTSEQLTTYAGLVLRNLLDRFDGDVDRAIGAYNGGVGNPNPNYAASVKNIALYARRVLEHARLTPARTNNMAL